MRKYDSFLFVNISAKLKLILRNLYLNYHNLNNSGEKIQKKKVSSRKIINNFLLTFKNFFKNNMKKLQ